MMTGDEEKNARAGAGQGGSAPLGAPSTLAVIDVGSTAVRLTVAEVLPGGNLQIVEEASRGVLLGKDTFTGGRITPETLEVTLKALEGFSRIMDGYGVKNCRAVATNAVREAINRENVLDRIRLRTGIPVEVIDGSEENRLTYMAVREALGDHEALKTGNTLLVEVGGGSADISFLRKGQPAVSGSYPLGALRIRRSLASWHGLQEQRVRLLSRHIRNVVHDIKLQMPLAEATYFIALGGDVRYAASRIHGDQAQEGVVRSISTEALKGFCDEAARHSVDELVERYHLGPADAETLVPALMACLELLSETGADDILVPEVTLRTGLLLDAVRGHEAKGLEDFRRQVLSSAVALGQKYRYDEAHADKVASLAVRLFDQLRSEHGLGEKDRLLLEVAALLHDVGMYISLRAHHKHTHYILMSSEVFGLSQDDIAIVANVARYHRRALPQKSHLPYTALDRDSRMKVGKLSAFLRLANALDADHMQNVRDVRLIREDEGWALEVEAPGDLTILRLASLARSDLFTDVFGQKLAFRESGVRS
jgi:exopolyphosphatase/guanosine-5'-triphosphate,3'-diphosphate pyrophosphatase